MEAYGKKNDTDSLVVFYLLLFLHYLLIFVNAFRDSTVLMSLHKKNDHTHYPWHVWRVVLKIYRSDI